MGRKGWAGSPPGDDAEARQRIVDAAVRVIERRGPADATLSDVAEDLGITRRTVYRYFANTDELFLAAADVALSGFVAGVKTIIGSFDDVSENLVEIVAYIIERLPDEPMLKLLLDNDRSNQFSRQLLRPAVIARCRVILQHSRIDWSALGYTESEIDELIEFMLRMIQSMVVAPPEPPRSPLELRRYLRRWMAPALSSQP
jgi:AcrR family transcriptional regulator